MTPAARPLERAQVVWGRARELGDQAQQHDWFSVALELLRIAHDDPTEIAHALRLGRTEVSDDADDAGARCGVKILERAIAVLGVKPTGDDVGERPRRG